MCERAGPGRPLTPRVIDPLPKKVEKKRINNKEERIANKEMAKKRKKEQFEDGKTEMNFISHESVMQLKGHSSEVITCAWRENGNDLLASGSGDGTARIWQIDGEVQVLVHASGEGARDVTTLDWSPKDSFLLATGCYDGRVRIWSDQDEGRWKLKSEGIPCHEGPIFQLQWSPSGKRLVSVGVEPSIALWELDPMLVRKGSSPVEMTAHALDVAWSPDEQYFAVCTTDRMVLIFDGSSSSEFLSPLESLEGHSDEVNAISWKKLDNDSFLLLSCSDDHTARIWQVGSDKGLILEGHAREIYTAKWQPNSLLVVATASFDATVRLWRISQDIDAVECIAVLKQHTQPVYAIDFSPDGQLLASGGLDGAVHIWSVPDGRLLLSWPALGDKKEGGNTKGIFELCWSSDGRKIAASTSSGLLLVFDLSILAAPFSERQVVKAD